MEKMGLNEIREKYLSFFEGKGHYRMKSHSLIPENDNSLLLISAGMAPLKAYFTGEKTPPSTKAVSCQKCVRLSDIENVGRYARYGTYFEMLGNFSFGDYFKKEAQTWAWEFVTQELKIPVERLHVSVYLEDDEAYDIWEKDIGVDPSHIVRLGKEDNFWEIGVGPCGPCSEIYIDRGEEYKCDNPNCSVGCDCDRYMEFWNLVFTQFYHDGNDNYTPLEKKNIDTGMGLERIACIMQDVDTIFEVDTMANIRDKVCEVTGAVYNKNPKDDISIRIITDHIRSATFMICDGVMPSNAGRGYVLRRLIRSASRHGRLLGMKDLFMYKLLGVVIEENEGAYPELLERQDIIRRVIHNEEERFAATIESGLKKLSDMMSTLSEHGTLSGENAFRLYDTDGFPLELTAEILQEKGFSVDRKSFEELMEKQRRLARSARANADTAGWEGEDEVLKTLPPTEFIGYDTLEDTAKILALITEGGAIKSAQEGENVRLILDKTPMYAESGGQLFDRGHVSSEQGRIMINSVTKSADGVFIHHGEVVSGEMNQGDSVTAATDRKRRQGLMRAHSATHLLHMALRKVLGEHVEQKGSLVDVDRLRFDFTHFDAVTHDQLIRVEDIVNEEVLKASGVSCKQMNIDDAKKAGAMALFGEKYGDVVRVVSVGDSSTELCGGTHVDNTGSIGLVRLVSESSIAAGVRRIEAVCGTAGLELLRRNDTMMKTAHSLLKKGSGDFLQKIEQVTQELQAVTKDNQNLQSRFAAMQAVELLNVSMEIEGITVVAAKLDAMSMEAMRTIGDMIRDRRPNIACVLASVQKDKVQFAAICGKDAVQRGVHAGNLVKAAAQICGGSGGGRPDSATAGGKDPTKVQDALDAIPGLIKEQITK